VQIIQDSFLMKKDPELYKFARLSYFIFLFFAIKIAIFLIWIKECLALNIENQDMQIPPCKILINP
jgi:hypothetical protein